MVRNDHTSKRFQKLMLDEPPGIWWLGRDVQKERPGLTIGDRDLRSGPELESWVEPTHLSFVSMSSA